MNTQFVTDSNGKKIAVLIPIKDYKKMMEDLEELDDIRIYDKAVSNDDGTRIDFNDYLKSRQLKNG